MRPRVPLGAGRRTPAAALLFAVVTLLALSVFAVHAEPVAAPSGFASASTAIPSWLSSSLPRHSAVPATPATLALSGASAGSVVATTYVNYNGSTPGNFTSVVWDWLVGGASYVPSTGQFWLSDRPTAVGSFPLPKTAPALVFDPRADALVGFVSSLANTSAMAFDPANGLLYATDPVNDTVAVFDPVTGAWAHAAITVGTTPSAIVYDSPTGHLWIANSGSNNVTVINGTSNTVLVGGIPVGAGPVGLADDPSDHVVFVADGGDNSLGRINSTSDAARPSFPLNGHASSVTYAPGTGSVAASVPSDPHVTILNASTGATVGFPNVGKGVLDVAATPNGTELVVADTSSSSLTLVSASNGVVLVASIPVGASPSELTMGPNGATVYSWSPIQRNLTIVNLTSNRALTSSPTLGADPSSLAYDPGSNRVFVAVPSNNSLSVLNATTFRTAAPTILLGSAPLSVATNPPAHRVYVGLVNAVVAINSSTGQIASVYSASIGANWALAVDRADGLLWVENSLNGLLALHLPALTLDIVVGVANGGSLTGTLALDPTTDELYAVDVATGFLTVINASTGHVIVASLAAGSSPSAVAYDPADQSVYVLGADLTVVDPLTNTVDGGPIPVAPHTNATALAYDPSRQFLYAVTFSASPAFQGTLTVLDGSSVAASNGPTLTIPVGRAPVALTAVPIPGATAAGSYEIWVGNFAAGTLSVVASPPRITYLLASPSQVDVGAPSKILLGLAGGAGPSEISYSGLPSSCASADTLALNCTPEAAGSYAITATAVDTLGFSAAAVTVLSVSPAMHVQLTLDSGTSAQVDLGKSVNGSASVLGGSAPFNYTWAFGDSRVAWGSDVAHTYATVGVYLVTVTVADAVGGVSSNTSTVTVLPLPALTISASPSNVTDVNVSVGFSASVTGGTTPGNATWTFGDGFSAYGATVHHEYGASGVYFATFYYRDSSGANASRFLMVQVNPAISATLRVATTPANAAVTTGSLLEFSTVISGGTEPYTVVWGFDDGSYGYGISVPHTYGTAATYTVTLFVEDAVGAQWNTTYHLAVASPASSSGFGSSFDNGLLLGLLVGAAAAAVILFAAARSKRPPPRRPPTPPTAYVPPAEAAEPLPWQEG